MAAAQLANEALAKKLAEADADKKAAVADVTEKLEEKSEKNLATQLKIQEAAIRKEAAEAMSKALTEAAAERSEALIGAANEKSQMYVEFSKEKADALREQEEAMNARFAQDRASALEAAALPSYTYP